MYQGADQKFLFDDSEAKDTRPAWHKPEISRIEIKKTMDDIGSLIDSTGSTN